MGFVQIETGKYNNDMTDKSKAEETACEKQEPAKCIVFQKSMTPYPFLEWESW